MGKVSDALEKSQQQAVPPDRDRSTDIESSGRDDNKTIALNSLVSSTTEGSEPEKREILDKGKGWQIVDPPQEAPKSMAAENRKHRPVFDDSKIDSNLIAYTAPNAYEAEQFRMLRTNVLFPKNGKPARSILVASTAPSEGKSFVASNLAISIAQNVDKHVLLIDCDMRKPSIHKLFGLGQVDGLSDYLTRGQPLPSLIQRTFIDRLSILPGGPPPINPAELLSSERMADLLKEVSRRYNDRFIIIDSPPILLTAESKVLAKFAHGVLLVTRFGRTDRRMALEVVRKIGKDKIIGVVGNFVDRKTVKKSYADKYSGYYGRYPAPR